MSRLNSNFFTYPLIGPSSNYQDYLADGIDPTEILNYLFKKSFGFPNAKPYDTYNNDLPDLYNSEKNVVNSKLYSQYIPESSLDLSPYIQDTSWTNPAYLPPNTANGTRYISSNYPYIAYYSNIKMVNASSRTSDSNTFFCGVSGFRDGNFSKNMIPYTFGIQNYQQKVFDSIGKELFFGFSNFGSWIVDADSGVLTFYDRINHPNYIVNRINLPRITFWRYEGLTGNSGIVNVGSY